MWLEPQILLPISARCPASSCRQHQHHQQGGDVPSVAAAEIEPRCVPAVVHVQGLRGTEAKTVGSIHLSIYRSIDPSICLTIHRSFYMFTFICLCVYPFFNLSVCLSVYLSIYLSTYLPTYLSIYRITLHCITLHFIYMGVCVCLSLSVSLCRHLQGSRQILKASQGPTYIFCKVFSYAYQVIYIYR